MDQHNRQEGRAAAPLLRTAAWIGALFGRQKRAPADVPAEEVAAVQPAVVDPTVYAIGDIHGRLDLLRPLEARIRADIRNNGPDRSVLVCLGDYVDRGSDSRGVVEHLSTRPPICDEEVFLRGNHEQVLLDFLNSADVLEFWSQFGGLETLVSYGLKPRLPLTGELREELRERFTEVLPAHHLAFLQSTRPCYETASYFFAHAGVNPARPLALQEAGDLMWIREAFLESTRLHGKLVVHGHTPVAAPEILNNRINADTGAYATGRLTCIVLDRSASRILTAQSSFP